MQRAPLPRGRPLRGHSIGHLGAACRRERGACEDGVIVLEVNQRRLRLIVRVVVQCCLYTEQHSILRILYIIFKLFKRRRRHSILRFVKGTGSENGDGSRAEKPSRNLSCRH